MRATALPVAWVCLPGASANDARRDYWSLLTMLRLLLRDHAIWGLVGFTVALWTIAVAVCLCAGDSRTAAGVLVAAGISSLACGSCLVWRVWSIGRLLARGIPVTGLVLIVEANCETASRLVIGYRYDGQPHRLLWLTGPFPTHRRGDEVRLLVDPDRPTHSLLCESAWA